MHQSEKYAYFKYPSIDEKYKTAKTNNIFKKIFNFFDNIIVNKRKEIYKVIYNNLNFKNIKSVLDVGATEDNKFKSSNYLTNNFNSKIEDYLDFFKVSKFVNNPFNNSEQCIKPIN